MNPEDNNPSTEHDYEIVMYTCESCGIRRLFNPDDDHSDHEANITARCCVQPDYGLTILGKHMEA